MTDENVKYTMECLKVTQIYANTLKKHFGITNVNTMQIGNLTRDNEGNKTSDTR